MSLALVQSDGSDEPPLASAERLTREFNHRVKNLLSVVTAIAYLSLRNARSMEEFEPAFTGRLEALSKAHELLAEAEWKRVPPAALAEQLLGCGEDERIRCGGRGVELGAKQLVGLALVLHELHSNAVRHGALKAPDGLVDVRWRRIADSAELVWSETGVQLRGEPRRRGFGLQMASLTARADLSGSIELDWRPTGLVATLRFPLPLS